MNPYRGEVEIELGGSVRVMRPTFEAITEIESRVGVGIVELVRRFQGNEWRTADVVIVVRSGLKGAEGKERTLNEVGSWVFEAGVIQCATVALKLLVNGLTGGKTAEENPPEPAAG